MRYLLIEMHMNAFLDPSNCLVLVNAVNFYLASTPPNQSLSQSRQIMKSTYEKTVLARMLSHKVVYNRFLEVSLILT